MSIRPDAPKLNGEPIVFMCTDVTYAVPRQIRLWGTTANGNTVCVKIDDFLPYFYFWFPQDSSVTEQEIKDALEEKLFEMEKEPDSVQSVHFVQRTSLVDNYTGRGHERFAKVTLSQPSLVKDCRNLLEHGQILKGYPAKTFEASIQFVLRFMIDFKFGGCDWLEFRDYEGAGAESARSAGRIPLEEDDRIPQTTAQYELTASCANLIVRQDLQEIAEIIVLSFDIEACKFQGRGFVDSATDPVTHIGYQVWSNKRGDLTNVCLSLVPSYNHSVAPVEGVEIVVCYTREEVLRGFRDAIIRYDPDIITGYNTDGFDWMYLFGSAKALGIENEFALFSRDVKRRATCKKVSKQSKGGGARVSYECVIEGRMSLDTYKFIKSTMKLRSYQLGNISKVLLGYSKVEMSYKLLPVYQMGTDEQRAHISKYCHWDAKLCIDIWKKKNVLMMYIQNARVNMIPLKYLVTRGQEIRGVSMVTREANSRNIILPSHVEKSDRTPEGALVLTPKKGLHTRPIVTLDYMSLYPSNIRWKNLCWTTVVSLAWAKSHLRESDYTIPPIHGVDYCFVKPHICKGLLPEIETRLHLKRLEAKAMRDKHPKGSDQWLFYEELQVAFKLSMNSLYGFTSAHQIPDIRITESVTAWGRFVLMQSKELVEREFPGSEVIYGDSVVADTPILILVDELIRYVTIEELWSYFECCEEESEKEYAYPRENVLTWSDNGWTPIKKIIRHFTDKRIFDVETNSGRVSVTEDHSLLDPQAQKVRPKDVTIGSRLLHAELPIPSSSDVTLNCAFALGLFLGYGVCINNVIHINHTDTGKLFRAINEMRTAYPLDYIVLKNNNAIHASGSIVRDWMKHYGRVPIDLLNASIGCVKTYLSGCNGCSGDGSKITQASLYLLNARIGNIFSDADSDVIKSIREIPHKKSQFVYDLETENHHFAAGVGKLIVHNTDSIFVCFGDVTLDRAFELGGIAAKMCTEHIGRLGIPGIHDLQREKGFLPFLMIEMKKYAGRKTLAPGKPFEMSSSGLENVRRDNSPIVSDLVEASLTEIIMNGDIRGEKAIENVHRIISDLLMNRVSMAHLIISKNLSKTYKHYEDMGSLQPHVELAKRKAKRGDELAATGDRVKFVFLAGAKGAKGHEKAEDPMYALVNKLTIDTDYYINNQLMKPLLRIFTPVLAKNEDFKKKNKAGKSVALNDKELKSLTAYKRLFTGDHMIHIVQKAVEGNAGIMQFAKKTVRCLGCKTPMTTKETHALCKKCKTGKMSDLASKTTCIHGYSSSCQVCKTIPIEDYLRHKLNSEQADLVTTKAECLQICRLCVKEPTAEEIPCSNDDCHNYWLRSKTAVDLEDIIERIKRF